MSTPLPPGALPLPQVALVAQDVERVTKQDVIPVPLPPHNGSHPVKMSSLPSNCPSCNTASPRSSCSCQLSPWRSEDVAAVRAGESRGRNVGVGVDGLRRVVWENYWRRARWAKAQNLRIIVSAKRSTTRPTTRWYAHTRADAHAHTRVHVALPRISA